MVGEFDNGSRDANDDASQVVCESGNGSCDTKVDASPMVSESDNGSWDANPMAKEVRRGVRRFLGPLRKKMVFLH